MIADEGSKLSALSIFPTTMRKEENWRARATRLRGAGGSLPNCWATSACRRLSPTKVILVDALIAKLIGASEGILATLV